jgi:hypothetical protein
LSNFSFFPSPPPITPQTHIFSKNWKKLHHIIFVFQLIFLKKKKKKKKKKPMLGFLGIEKNASKNNIWQQKKCELT